MTRRWLALAATLVLLVGCGADDSSDAGPGPTDLTPPEPTTGATFATVAQADWLTATLEIDQPDGLAALGDAVFVKTDKGFVVRVDAATATVEVSEKVDDPDSGPHYCTGIGSDGTSLWTCAAGRESTDVLRLDPETLEVTKRVAVDKVFDQLTIPVVDGRVWVLSGSGERVSVVDARTGDTKTRPLGERCFQLAATPTRVFATCMLDDEVLALDAATGKVVARADVQNPINISASGDDVWVSGASGLQHLTADLHPVATYDGLIAGPEGDVVATPGAVWVRQAAGFLFRLDPATGAVKQYAIDPVPSGGSVLVTDDAVWVSEYNDNVVRRVDPGR